VDELRDVVVIDVDLERAVGERGAGAVEICGNLQRPLKRFGG
jgi:hypothetical protein